MQVRMSQFGKQDSDELKEKPEPEHSPGGNPDEIRQQRKDHQHLHARLRITEQVGAHDSGDCTARADSGNIQVRIRVDVRHPSQEAAQKVEHEVYQMAEMVLDVVAENPKHPHISDDVQH